MKKIYFVITVLFSILLISSCQSQQQTQTQVTGNTIEITSSGFSPSTLTINMGNIVTWINKDAVEHWPASAIHPTHAVYPETGGCIGSKFDACKGLKQDESWQFTFNQKGEWKYHDHLNVAFTGTIVVK